MTGLGRGGVGRLAAAAFVLLCLPAAGWAQDAEPPAAVVIAPAPLPSFTSAQAAQAMAALRGADSHGLRAADYLTGLPGPDAAPETADQERLAKALLRYARDLRVGRLQAGEFPELWGLRPAPYDPAQDLARALEADRLGTWLDSLAPRYAGYEALRRGLARYRAIAAEGGWRRVPEGPAFGLGAQGPRVSALRARLAVEDSTIAAQGDRFDAPLQQALVRAEKRFGLKPDGIADPGALAALNQPVERRIQQIVANMERWRWMPQELPPTRVQVNAGAAIVTYFRDNRPVLSMKAVSGRPGDETPMLRADIHSIVLNPPWNVPASIAAKELWPKEKRSPGYLARNGFITIKTDSGVRLQQKAGEQSSLGRYKFDFDNPYSVFLHDTPSRAAFANYARQASHGCVRLEKPAELAAILLQGDPAWTPEAIAAAVDAGKTQRVRLAEPTPVFILYWTAFGGVDGQVNFRTDSYNWDQLLLKRVGVLAAA